MRKIEKTSQEQEPAAIPCKVLVCLRLIPERNLMVVGQEAGENSQSPKLIFLVERRGVETYRLLESNAFINSSPLDLAMKLVHFDASLKLRPEQFERNTSWITSEDGRSVWEHLYFADLVEAEANSVLLSLPNRKTFTQKTFEEVYGILLAARRGHFLRLRDSHWFSDQNIKKAA